MYHDPENGEMKVEILNVKEIQNGRDNEDFEYTINVGGQERTTYADKLKPIYTENYEPSAPPLTSHESKQHQSIYPAPFSQHGLVHFI
jgi:hypothetical protein